LVSKATAEGGDEPGSQAAMPPCPRCGTVAAEPTNFCGSCGADLRGLGGETDTLVGSILGKVIDDRYRIVQKLGEGGMGSVYKVEHVRMGKICALKLLRRDLVEGPKGRGLRERFRQEARIVSKLVHVNTIQVFDFGETDEGELYLAMEYVRGRSLHDVQREAGGRLPEARVTRIASQILRSLAEAHEVGIIHRDIKPQNIMILDLRDRTDFVKVLDFGIAKVVAGGPDDPSTTGAGEIVGTPNYISPEQARGSALDQRSDLYSLGAVMFDLLTGRAPFVAETPLGVVTAHLTQPVPAVTKVLPEAHVSPEMEAVLQKAMAKRPEDRFTSADEMRLALKGLTDAEAITTGTHRIPPQVQVTGQDLLVRADFDRFARGLVVRRVLSAVIPLVLLAGAIGGGWAWLSRAPIPITHESEPNNDPNRANRLIPVEAKDLAAVVARRDGKARPMRGVDGYIGRRLSETQGDADWYRIEVPKKDGVRRLYLEATGIPNMDIVLELLHARGDGSGKLEVVARSDAHGNGVGEILPNLRVTPGTWYVLVREIQQVAVDGTVGAPIENVSDAYHLYAALMPPAPNGEIEPDDTPNEATPLAMGASRTGRSGAAGQEDWWRIDTPPAGRIEVAVHPGAGAKLGVELWDAAGLAARDAAAKSVPSGPGHERRRRHPRPHPLARKDGAGTSLVVAARVPAKVRSLWVRVATLQAVGAARTAPYRITATMDTDGDAKTAPDLPGGR